MIMAKYFRIPYVDEGFDYLDVLFAFMPSEELKQDVRSELPGIEKLEGYSYREVIVHEGQPRYLVTDISDDPFNGGLVNQRWVYSDELKIE